MIDDASEVPLAPMSDAAAPVVDVESGIVVDAVVFQSASQRVDEECNGGETSTEAAAPPIETEEDTIFDSPPPPSSSLPPPPSITGDDTDTVDDEAMAVDASIELDEEGGQLEEVREDQANDNDGADDDDDDDDDISVPPPPPPPMPPTIQSGGGSIGIGSSSSKAKKKTKIALIATVAILVCAGIGLGVGFGLTSGGGESSSSANYSNQVDSGSSSGGTNSDSESVTSTTSTGATSWSTTDATTAETNMNDSGGDGDGNTTTSATTSTDATGEIQTYDAVIIGAGWAGIRAAETLLNEGITSILVLEASDYIGGRARSFNGMDGSTNNPDTIGSVNIPYDLGADWIYDNGNEMVTALTDGGYLDAVSGNDATSSVLLSSAQFYKMTTTGNNGDDDGGGGGTMTAEVVEASDQWIEEVWNVFLTFRENNLEELNGLSYQEAIDQFIDQFSWTDDESLQFLNVIEDTMEYEYTADSSQLDINGIEFYPPGFSIDTQYMGVPGFGFGNLAAQYAESTTVQEKVLLNAKVTEINSSSSQEEGGLSRVTYVNNDGTDVVVQAKTVLVTVSLGVLKANTIDFIPSLPDSKVESISNMGFGTVNKCMMSWNSDDDLVWPEDEYWFLLLTPEDGNDETQQQQQQQQYSPWTTFFNPTKFKGKPSLTAWLGGKEAIYAEENQTDDEILEDVMMNLRAMFPTIREPDRVIITRWGQDPNTLGAYSYPVPGRDFYDDAAKLSEVYGNIYFAGEATGNGWATTQGAWRTGEAAALSMAEILRGR